MIRDDGNAYKLDGHTLVTAAINADGSVDLESWSEVDFYSIDSADATYCAAIMTALRAIALRDELYANSAHHEG